MVGHGPGFVRSSAQEMAEKVYGSSAGAGEEKEEEEAHATGGSGDGGGGDVALLAGQYNGCVPAWPMPA